MAIYHEDRDVHEVDRPVERRLPDDEVVVEERHGFVFAPGQVVSVIIGVLAVIMGLIAITRAGLDRPFSDPVVDVAGWSHTTWLGFGELAVGVLLILAGTTPAGRAFGVLIGTLAVIGAVLFMAEPSVMPDEVAMERSFGWPVLICGLIVALTWMLLPTWRRSSARRAVDVR